MRSTETLSKISRSIHIAPGTHKSKPKGYCKKCLGNMGWCNLAVATEKVRKEEKKQNGFVGFHRAEDSAQV